MLKKTAALLIGLAMILTAAACTNQQDTTKATEPSTLVTQTEEATAKETETVPVTEPSAEPTTEAPSSETEPAASVTTEDVVMGDQLVKGRVVDIQKFTDKDKTVLRQLLKNSIIAGDSRVEAIVDYGILGEDICISLYGGYAGNSKEIAEQAANLYPEKVLFFMGINDPKWYYDDYTKFLSDYKADIDAYKAINPYSDIYVCNLIQVSEKRQGEVPAFKLVPEYNKRLEALCAQEGWHYIDGNLYLQPKYYLEDGSHFTEEFYCYLIQQFVLEMGLWE